MNEPQSAAPTTPKVRHALAPAVWTDWSVNQIRAALYAHEVGDFTMSSILADHLRRDDRIYASLESRVLGILGLPFAIKRSDDVADEALTARLAEDVGNWWWRAVPEAVAADIERNVQMMGFAVAETFYENTSAERLRPSVVVHHLQHVTWRQDEQRFYLNTIDGPVPVTPGDGRWMLFAPAGLQRPWMNGAVRALAIPFAIRSFVRRDWARRSEIEGVGVRKAGIPEQADSKVVDAFLRDVQRLGNETTIRLPPGYTFELEVTDASAADGFQKLISHCDSAITLTLLGQNMTTQIEGGGSYAAATVHAGVLRVRLAADVATLATTLREQLLMPWGRLNEPDWDDDAAPWPTWNTAVVEDQQQKAQSYLTISQAITSFKAAGVDTRSVLEEFGLKLVDGETGKLPEIYAYHIDAGIPLVDEVRDRLKLPALPNGEGQIRTGPNQTPEPPVPEPPPEPEDATEQPPPTDVLAPPKDNDAAASEDEDGPEA